MAATPGPGANMIAQYKTYKNQVNLKPGQGLGFTTGKGYYARPGGGGAPGPVPAPADPLGQWTPQQISQATAKYSGMYGTPMNPGQIQSAAQAQLDPIIAAITKSINDRAGQATASLAANSAAVAKELGQIDYGAPYAGAKQEQAAVDAALQQSLDTSGGTGLAQDLSSRLGQINDPSVAAAASGVADRGAAIGTTELAHGSNALSNLIAQAAALKEYGVKQPGIARLSGLQDIASVQRQATSDIGSQTSQIMQQLPGIVQSLRAEATNTRSNRAQAAASLYEALTGQNITKATAKAGLVGDQSKLQHQQGQDTFNNSLNYAKTYKVDPVTGAPLPGYTKNKNGQVVKAPVVKAPPGISAGKAADIATKAAKDAEDLYHGVTKPNPKDPNNPIVVSYTQTYQDAIKTLTQRYPSLGVKGARKLVNAWYKPGEYGRPAFTGPPATAADWAANKRALQPPSWITGGN